MFKISIRSYYDIKSKFESYDQFLEVVSKLTHLSIDQINSFLDDEQKTKREIEYFNLSFHANLMDLGEDFFEFLMKNSDYNSDRILMFDVKRVRTLKALIEEGGKISLAPRDTIHVHIPSNELFKVTKTKLLEDSCTDALQDDLDSGWGIIAVIPRPGQRRPDYILGRSR